MLAYAASRPVVARRSSSPNAMLAIIAAHVALIAAVMSAKMDLPHRILDAPIKIDLIPAPKPPPPETSKPPTPQPRMGPAILQPPVQVPLPPTALPIVDSPPAMPDLGPGAGAGTGQAINPVPLPDPGKIEARLLTPAAELKPPYPESKLLTGEEAILRLRLTIDDRGRVVAVDPVGRADRIFLASARRHLMEHWRYRPASEGGRAVTSSVVITLRFRVDG
jgi:protein TonB